jgi:hypothetical protein
MPLLDHFHPPLQQRYPWDSFHSGWATHLAEALNELLPPEYIAAEHTHVGAHLEIDVATFERSAERRAAQPNGSTVVTAAPRVYTPPAPARVMPAIFPDSFEVRILSTTSGLTLVGAIELISPANKDRPDERHAFATKCASYLHQGVSVIIIDVVTNRRANLHNDVIRTLAVGDDFLLPAEQHLYAVAYRPVLRQERAEIDLWTANCAVGEPLPTMPLRLTGDLFVPVDFETAYRETCRRRRLA